ncbi:hypothetical protein UlMin_004390 [Ulmus minor]
MSNFFGHSLHRILGILREVLSLTEFKLMQLLDVGMEEVSATVARISEITCPPYQTVLSLLEQLVRKEDHGGHLPTHLKGLDEALCGGLPFNVLTELVGLFCIKLSLLTSWPATYGGLNGRVVYIDLESKFSSRRMIEIGMKCFPKIFNMKRMAQEMARRILVLRPTSVPEFTERNYNHGASRQPLLGWHISFLKSLAELSRIPIVVTNQVRSQSHEEARQFSFQVRISKDTTGYDSHLIAALGINWAHAMTIRLVLESKSGQNDIINFGGKCCSDQ